MKQLERELKTTFDNESHSQIFDQDEIFYIMLPNKHKIQKWDKVDNAKKQKYWAIMASNVDLLERQHQEELFSGQFQSSSSDSDGKF